MLPRGAVEVPPREVRGWYLVLLVEYNIYRALVGNEL